MSYSHLNFQLYWVKNNILEQFFLYIKNKLNKLKATLNKNIFNFKFYFFIKPKLNITYTKINNPTKINKKN